MRMCVLCVYKIVLRCILSSIMKIFIENRKEDNIMVCVQLRMKKVKQFSYVAFCLSIYILHKI